MQRRPKHGFSISFYANLLLPKSLRTLFVIPSKRDRQEEKEDQIRRKKTIRKMYKIPNTPKLGFAKEERTSNGLRIRRIRQKEKCTKYQTKRSYALQNKKVERVTFSVKIEIER